MLVFAMGLAFLIPGLGFAHAVTTLRSVLVLKVVASSVAARTPMEPALA